MSLVPYETYPPVLLDNVELTLLGLLTLTMLVAIGVALYESPVPAKYATMETQTETNPPCTDIVLVNENTGRPIRSCTLPPFHSLDTKILKYLETVPNPVPAKDIAKALNEDKSDINKRLYHLKRNMKVTRYPTYTAPLWCI